MGGFGLVFRAIFLPLLNADKHR